MKNFLLGVFATALAAILAYVAQTYWDEYKNSNGNSLQYVRYTPDLILTKEKTSEWFKGHGNEASERALVGGIRVTMLEIENTGRLPLTNQDVRISPVSSDFPGEGVIGFQNHLVPGGDEQGTRTALRDRSLLIRYTLFNPGDTHVLWVVSDRFTDLDFIARRPGLSVRRWTVGVSSWDEDEDSGFVWQILLYFFVAIISLLAGMMLLDVVMTRALKNRGHNLKEIMAKKPEKDKDSG